MGLRLAQVCAPHPWIYRHEQLSWIPQDAGAHRRSAHAEPTVEGEQWKRAFWVLMYLDREVSSMMGRACAIQYDE